MATDPERYLTVDELEEEIPFSPNAFGIDDTETDTDGHTDWHNLLERFLDDESDRVERATDTLFVETTTTETLYGDEDAVGDDLVLPDRPVVSVDSIDADGEVLDVGTDTRVRETHVTLENDAPIHTWPDGPIEVSWTYGHSEVPGDVHDTIVRLVRSRLERIQSDGLESESMPTGQSGSYRPPEEVMAAALSAVSNYRAPSYGSGTMVI